MLLLRRKSLPITGIAPIQQAGWKKTLCHSASRCHLQFYRGRSPSSRIHLQMRQRSPLLTSRSDRAQVPVRHRCRTQNPTLIPSATVVPTLTSSGTPTLLPISCKLRMRLPQPSSLRIRASASARLVADSELVLYTYASGTRAHACQNVNVAQFSKSFAYNIMRAREIKTQELRLRFESESAVCMCVDNLRSATNGTVGGHAALWCKSR